MYERNILWHTFDFITFFFLARTPIQSTEYIDDPYYEKEELT